MIIPNLTPEQINALRDLMGTVEAFTTAHTALDAILDALPKPPEPIKDGAYLVVNSSGERILHFVKGEASAVWCDKNGDLLNGGWPIHDKDRDLYTEANRVILVPAQPSDELVNKVSRDLSFYRKSVRDVIDALGRVAYGAECKPMKEEI